MIEQTQGWFVTLTMYFLVPVGVGALLAVMPWLSRQETWFAVTVAPNFRQSEAGHRVLRTYLKGIAGLVLLVLVMQALVLWLSNDQAMAGLAHVSGLLFLSLAGLVVFIHCRRQLLPYSQSQSRQREVSLEPPLTARQIIPGPFWLQAVPYLLVLLPMSWIALHFAEVPDQVVVHVGMDSISHGDKSIRTVFSATAVMLFSLVLVHLVMLVPFFMRRLPNQIRRSRGINLILLQVMFIMGVLGGFLAFLPLHGEAWVNHPLGLGLMLGSTLLMLFVPVVTGWRVLCSDEPSVMGDRSPDECWYLGMLYYNPEDPALWVEKRFGVGYTVNFARPTAWLVIAGLVVLTAGMVTLTTG